jgi:hypothetical protein
MKQRLWFTSLILSVLTCATSADPRPWTFTYDTYSAGKGNFEFEQWVTWETHKQDEKGFDRIRFREEFEYGITDNFDIAIYLPNWNYEDSNERKGTRYEGVSLETIFYISKPTDLVGVGLYNEITVGESGREFEFEQKLLLHKDVGPWSFAYNFIVETEVEREEEEDGEFENEIEGVLGHAFGVSYGVNKNWRIGGELTIESIYEDWSRYEKTEVYAGPAIHYSGNGIPGTKANWWVTVTPAFQLSNHDEEPDFIVRMIAGIEF